MIPSPRGGSVRCRSRARRGLHRLTLVLLLLCPAVLAVVSCTASGSGGDTRTTDGPSAVLAGQRSGGKQVKVWPNPTNTGAHGELREISGRTIRKDGRVLRNVLVTGQLTIEAQDVTLDNVYVRTDELYGVLVWEPGATVLDTTIEGTAGETLAGLAAYAPGTVEARRLHVYGSEDGVRLAHDSVLAGSYVHALRGTGTSHFDTVTADGFTGWRIVRNRLLNRHTQTAVVWVGDPRFDPSSGVLKGNKLAGGGYSVYGGPGVEPGIRVLDNRFSTRFHPKGGYWGPVAYWESRNNTWSGNTWSGGPRDGRAVKP